jgi:hypothetical protein
MDTKSKGDSRIYGSYLTRRTLKIAGGWKDGAEVVEVLKNNQQKWLCLRKAEFKRVFK